MDEDAYQLLDNYLKNLRLHFRKEEGASEIIADFEARIEELFSERIRLGYEVISIEQVEEVIARVGKPTDFSDANEDADAQEHSSGAQPEEKAVNRKSFFRNPDDKMLGGICSGIAAYFGWNAIWVRIIMCFVLFASHGILLAIYIVCWVVIPEARTATEKLEMQGKPITVENIGKTVAADAEKPIREEKRGCLQSMLDLLVGLIKIFLIGIGFLIGLPLIFALIIAIIVLFSVVFGVGGGLLGILPFSLVNDSSLLMANHPILAAITFIFLLGIPLVALIYTLIAYLAKWRPVNSALKCFWLIVWVIALVLFLCSGFRINSHSFFNFPWEEGWYFDSTKRIIEGNGILSEQTHFITEPIDYIETENLTAFLLIEQTDAEQSSLVISGDENLIEKIEYRIKNNRLHLSSGMYRLKTNNNVEIRFLTPQLKGIETESFAKVSMPKAFRADKFEVKMDGAGKFRADSLDITYLKVASDGIGSVVVAGKARNTRLQLDGVGSIDALELVSDSVFAQVNGVGSIKCNPVDYLKGSVNGIGKLHYKEEPKKKSVRTIGIGSEGKIGRD
jgi:phage shock protein PspC (stress-responsive transcriptional regulator)